MTESREYPGAFDEVVDSPSVEPQRKACVNGHGGGGDQALSPTDFYAHMPTHRYIFAPCRQLWPARSVNARLGFIDGSLASDSKLPCRADDVGAGTADADREPADF